MTPATFKTIRARLGLSAAKMGVALGGIEERSVRRYESGERSVPPSVAILMHLYIAAKDSPTLTRALARALQEVTGGEG